ncbi:MAG: metal ABC transporter permease [Tannerella sp.]|nr:metal ABC transporter permease [Tannerella sp.]
MEILQYTFFRHALWSSLLMSIACGLVGTYVVSRRLVFISGGITHASFGGLGIGFYLGINPFLGALGFAVLSAFGVEWASKSYRVREDSAIAAVWSLGMAVGMVFIVLTPGYAPNLSSYLFGNILTVSQTDILWTAAFVAVLCTVFAALYREIVYSAFDRDFAVTQGLPVKAVECLMTVCIAVTIVLSIRLVGIMLLMSMLTVPQMTVNLFTAEFRRIVTGSILLCLGACIAGLFLSYYLRIPSGTFIIIVLILFFLLAKGALFLHGNLRRKMELRCGKPVQGV